MRMNITKKLLTGFISILILIIIITSLTFSAFSYFDNFLSSNDDMNKKVDLLNDMEKVILKEYMTVTDYLIDSDNSFKEKLEKEDEIFQNNAETLLSMGSENKNNIEEIIKLKEQLNGLLQEMIIIKKSTEDEPYIHLLNQSRSVVDDIEEITNNLRMNYQAKIEDANGGLKYMTQFSNKTITGISIAAIIIGLAIALYISRIISKPLKRIAKAADEIGNGNLLIDEIKVKNKDEIGQLALSFNKMVLDIRNLIENVRDNSEHVASSAEELMASSKQTSSSSNQITKAIQEVSNGTEIQVKATENSAEAIGELGQGIQRVADTISSLTESTNDTTKQANTGSELLKNVISQMHSINQSTMDTNKLIAVLDGNSKKIGNIIDAITEIAEQTNLLALNATIESSRAGEHGKGFAVVADEIRKLAGQSRHSASEISNLVEFIQSDVLKVVKITKNSSDQVKEGYRLVEDTGENFGNILNAVEHVSKETEKLSSLSEVMSTSMNTVTESIKEVSSIANTTMANTEEIAASSEEQLATTKEVDSSASHLAQIAEQLNERINTFKI